MISPKDGTIVLCMIAGKDEGVIERCLRSAKPLVDTYVIHCNGGDGTAAKAREVMGDMPGEIVECEWVGQEHNRNAALKQALAMGNYVLNIDPDDMFEIDPGFEMPSEIADSYEAIVLFKSLEFPRKVMLRTGLPWQWRATDAEGKTHPLPSAKGEGNAHRMQGLTVVGMGGGGTWSDPQKHHDKAAALRRTVAANPNDARARYYLAQSCRDAGLLEEAAFHYKVRAEMSGTWEEERWNAQLCYAKALENLRRPITEVVEAYGKAAAQRPTRAESTFHLARYYAQMALVNARHAASLEKPDDRLFVEWMIYSGPRKQQNLALALQAAMAEATGRGDEAAQVRDVLQLRGCLPGS